MNEEVYITCAVTPLSTDSAKSPHRPVTPKQIATSAIAAAQAGAAIVYLHIQDPRTGGLSTQTALYRELIKHIRENSVDVIINLACAAGGSQVESMRHVIDLCHEGAYRPDIATLDCGPHCEDGTRTRALTPDFVRQGLRMLQELKVKASVEVSDS